MCVCVNDTWAAGLLPTTTGSVHPQGTIHPLLTHSDWESSSTLEVSTSPETRNGSRKITHSHSAWSRLLIHSSLDAVWGSDLENQTKIGVNEEEECYINRGDLSWREAAESRMLWSVVSHSCAVFHVVLMAQICVSVSVWKKAKGKVQVWGCVESLPRQNRFILFIQIFNCKEFSRNPRSSFNNSGNFSTEESLVLDFESLMLVPCPRGGSVLSDQNCLKCTNFPIRNFCSSLHLIKAKCSLIYQKFDHIQPRPPYSLVPSVLRLKSRNMNPFSLRLP